MTLNSSSPINHTEGDWAGPHAVILAGGKGVRLRPYTTCLPKPLVPIGDEHSILDIVLSQLAYRGFRSATLAIGHLGQLIRAYIGDGLQWGIAVDYQPEDTPLGTMGPLIGMLDRLPEHFLVMNGDVLTDLDYGGMLATHAASGAQLTVATYERSVKIDFGVLETDGAQIVGFREKPTLGYSVSMGVYALSRETLRRYRPGQPLGFDDLVLDQLAAGNPPATHAFNGYWLDIGRPDDYDRANEEFERIKDDLLPPVMDASPRIMLAR
jgi:NDP-mannose synthase